MRKNEKNEGITLIALIITIIVLIILAGVSLNAVFNKNGIFSRAESATKLYGKEKSREKLMMVLADAEMKKYTNGLTSDELNEMLNKAGQVDDTDNTIVTVDGHNWLIDRNKLEIVDYLGEDDGIEISYTVEGNDNYIDGTPNISVHVTVKNNKGTLDINSIQITKNGVLLTGIAIQSDGTFTLLVTEEEGATFTVSAKNSTGEQSTPRTIKIVPKRDNTPPVISGQSVKENGMKIKIKAEVADPESGVSSFIYNVSGPGSVTPASGTSLTSGVEMELTTDTPGSYTVTFTATNGAGKSTTTEEIKVITTDGISISELKSKIKASNYPEYIGRKVNYKPGDTKAWRVFYYDATGEFGDGAGTIYLKRDYDTTMTLSSYVSSGATENGEKMMKQLNPLWRDSENGKKARENYLNNEKAVAGLCDTANWTRYCDTSVAKYAIGAAPIEMWYKAYNAYVGKYEPSNVKANCGILNTNGYGWGLGTGNLSTSQTISIDTSIPQSAAIATGSHEWLASPSSHGDEFVCLIDATSLGYYYSSYDPFVKDFGFCPVVSLNH